MKWTRILTDGEYEKVMVTKEWNNGDWNLRFALKILYMDQYVSEEELKDTGKYYVEILAVSPEAAGDELQKAIDSMGMEDEDLNRIPLLAYEALIEYGVFATLWYKSGNNLKKLIAEANKEFKPIECLFGFYMDRPENRIGNDGWDFISGNIGFKNLS